MRETVLDSYQRLEAEAVWRPDAEAQGRNVVVSIGTATLTVTDLSDSALAHWSLASLVRMNPGKTPAVFSPGADAPETLETDDPEMIAALERVMRAVRKGGRRYGRLKWVMRFAAITAMVAMVFLWLPNALARYAASIVPDASRAMIGAQMIRHIERLTGAPCFSQTGDLALSKLERRLFPTGDTKLSVSPSALSGATYLPGGHIVLSHKLIEDYETPAVAAAYAIDQDNARQEADGLERLLAEAGLFPMIRLLTTGDLPDATLRRHAEHLVGAALRPVDIAAAAPRIAEAGLSVDELADALQGEAPKGFEISSPPALTDGEWIALQSMCTD